MMLKDCFKNILNSSLIEKIIGNVAYWYLILVGKTTKWKIMGLENAYKSLEKSDSIIIIGWHGRALMMPYFWNQSRTLNALVSPHRDGRLIVNILKKFGVGNIDGSTNNNPNEAALNLMRNLQQGNSIAIVPDGPRGPAMELGMSPIFYAKKSGKPVVGITYSVVGAKIVEKSWDRMLLPLPFHKGIYAVTTPLYVPADANNEELEMYRQKMEKELNSLTWQIDKEMGLPFIPQGTVRKSRRQDVAEKINLTDENKG